VESDQSLGTQGVGGDHRINSHNGADIVHIANSDQGADSHQDKASEQGAHSDHCASSNNKDDITHSADSDVSSPLNATDIIYFS